MQPFVSLSFDFKLRIGIQPDSKAAPKFVADSSSNTITRKASLADVLTEPPSSYQHKVSTKYLWTLMNFHPANVALRILLNVSIQYPQYLGNVGWTCVWYVLCLMRDFTALPFGMVHTECWGLNNDQNNENTEDFLHDKARDEFESRMAVARSKTVNISKDDFGDFIKEQTAKPSILSFQGLGEALFGTSSAANQEKISEALNVAIAKKKESEGIRSVVAGRWNSGYCQDSNALSDLEFIHHANMEKFDDPAIELSWNQSLQRLGRQTIILLRY